MTASKIVSARPLLRLDSGQALPGRRGDAPQIRDIRVIRGYSCTRELPPGAGAGNDGLPSFAAVDYGGQARMITDAEDSTEGSEDNEGFSLEPETIFVSFAIFCKKTHPNGIRFAGVTASKIVSARPPLQRMPTTRHGEQALGKLSNGQAFQPAPAAFAQGYGAQGAGCAPQSALTL